MTLFTFLEHRMGVIWETAKGNMPKSFGEEPKVTCLTTLQLPSHYVITDIRRDATASNKSILTSGSLEDLLTVALRRSEHYSDLPYWNI